MHRTAVALVVAALILASPAPGSADTLEPAQWPPELALGSAPNALRFAGTDRYQTSLAMALALRGAGAYPYDTADRTAAGAATLAGTGHWWGASTCPRSVIMVAGDNPADALAAAPLSDPTNRSNEPRIERVATADPVFDPIGGFDRVDTASAPIVVTASGRSGAVGLSAPARAAVTDLRRGGCDTAREAIIVGGEAAVPGEVEDELVSLGYEEVFRVAGLDRFDTAARIAAALGTETQPAGATCVDGRGDDGSTDLGFYGNSVIEYRRDATSCELHGRTIVLADGEIGADALAAGWWTSYWQVPVLLVRGDGSIPEVTRSALGSIPIDTIVVLGGTGRVPEEVVQEATRIAGAVAGRFGGRDRYETSVSMARAFGGWHPTGDPDDFEGDRLCIASSSGRLSGWPDALAAGPLCGRLAEVAATRPAPPRVLEPVEAAAGPVTPARPAHAAAPVLLVPAGAAAPTPPVADLLAAVFPSTVPWCRGGSEPGCRAPGFSLAFGGTSAVTDSVLAEVSAALAGGDAAQRGAAPGLVEPFRTSLDLAPVFAGGVAGGEPSGCVERAAVSGARWLAVYADAALTDFGSAVDLVSSGSYVAGSSRPLCVPLSGAGEEATLVSVSVAGRASPREVLRGEPTRAISMSGPMDHGGPLATSGEPGTSTAPGTETTWRFRDSPPSPLTVSDGGEVAGVQEAAAFVLLRRAGAGTPVRFVATISIDRGVDRVTGEASGEATLVGAAWELAGRMRLPGATGGFRATLSTNSTADNADDLLTWRLDATRP